MFFVEVPIYIVTNNIVERLKVSSIKISLDKRLYESNPQNANFDDFPFDGDERLIGRKWIFCINDDIVFRLINSSGV